MSNPLRDSESSKLILPDGFEPSNQTVIAEKVQATHQKILQSVGNFVLFSVSIIALPGLLMVFIGYIYKEAFYQSLGLQTAPSDISNWSYGIAGSSIVFNGILVGLIFLIATAAFLMNYSMSVLLEKETKTRYYLVVFGIAILYTVIGLVQWNYSYYSYFSLYASMGISLIIFIFSPLVAKISTPRTVIAHRKKRVLPPQEEFQYEFIGALGSKSLSLLLSAFAATFFATIAFLAMNAQAQANGLRDATTILESGPQVITLTTTQALPLEGETVIVRSIGSSEILTYRNVYLFSAQDGYYLVATNINNNCKPIQLYLIKHDLASVTAGPQVSPRCTIPAPTAP